MQDCTRDATDMTSPKGTWYKTSNWENSFTRSLW